MIQITLLVKSISIGGVFEPRMSMLVLSEVEGRLPDNFTWEKVPPVGSANVFAMTSETLVTS
jgi:hypothetical protein